MGDGESVSGLVLGKLGTLQESWPDDMGMGVLGRVTFSGTQSTERVGGGVPLAFQEHKVLWAECLRLPSTRSYTEALTPRGMVWEAGTSGGG